MVDWTCPNPFPEGWIQAGTCLLPGRKCFLQGKWNPRWKCLPVGQKVWLDSGLRGLDLPTPALRSGPTTIIHKWSWLNENKNAEDPVKYWRVWTFSGGNVFWGQAECSISRWLGIGNRLGILEFSICSYVKKRKAFPAPQVHLWVWVRWTRKMAAQLS